MADSYFELLTGQQGLPAKPFDPIGELQRLRRRLALRIQNFEPPEKSIPFSFRTENNTDEIPLLSPYNPMPSEVEPPPIETVSLESVVKQVGNMKRTLTLWQRSRSRASVPHADIFRGNRHWANKKRIPSVATRCLTVPQEGTLEMVNAGLTALGIVGVVFGLLSVFRGWESDLSLGTMVCLSGAATITIGLGGRFLALRADLS